MAGSACSQRPRAASYCSTTLAGMRPRSLTARPCCFAQARISPERCRLAAVRPPRRAGARPALRPCSMYGASTLPNAAAFLSRLDSPLFSLSPHTPPSLSQQQRPGHPPGTPERPGDRNHGQDGEFASGYEARADGQASRSASAVSSRSASPVLTTLSGPSSSEAASVAARGQCSTLRRLRLGPPG